MDKAEQPTITQAQYESAVKGRQDFRNAYRNLLPVLRAAEGIVAIWRAKGRKVDVTEYWDAINALDVAVTGGGARPDPEHLTRTTSLAAQDVLVEALRRALRFVEALADNEPDEPIADNGMTVLSKLQYDAPPLIFKMRAALHALEGCNE